MYSFIKWCRAEIKKCFFPVLLFKTILKVNLYLFVIYIGNLHLLAVIHAKLTFASGRFALVQIVFLKWILGLTVFQIEFQISYTIFLEKLYIYFLKLNTILRRIKCYVPGAREKRCRGEIIKPIWPQLGYLPKGRVYLLRLDCFPHNLWYCLGVPLLATKTKEREQRKGRWVT